MCMLRPQVRERVCQYVSAYRQALREYIYIHSRSLPTLFIRTQASTTEPMKKSQEYHHVTCLKLTTYRKMPSYPCKLFWRCNTYDGSGSFHTRTRTARHRRTEVQSAYPKTGATQKSTKKTPKHHYDSRNTTASSKDRQMHFAAHLVAERAHGASLEPSLDAVKVEHMATAAEGD